MYIPPEVDVTGVGTEDPVRVATSVSELLSPEYTLTKS
jgi:hypothetical protein